MKHVFRVLTLLYIVAVAVFCFANFSSLPVTHGRFFGIETDKLIHFSMFLPFPILVSLSFPPASRKWLARVGALMLYLLTGCVLAAVTEYIQGQLPYRTMDPRDFVADVCGMVVAIVIVIVFWVRRRGRSNA